MSSRLTFALQFIIMRATLVLRATETLIVDPIPLLPGLQDSAVNLGNLSLHVLLGCGTSVLFREKEVIPR